MKLALVSAAPLMVFGLALTMLAGVACAKSAAQNGPTATGQTELMSADVTGAASAARASCDTIAELGTCTEHVASGTLGLEKALCDGYHGKFANTACASGSSGDAVIGSCAIPNGRGGHDVRRYYSGHLKLADAKADCASDAVRGVFTP